MSGGAEPFEGEEWSLFEDDEEAPERERVEGLLDWLVEEGAEEEEPDAEEREEDADGEEGEGEGEGEGEEPDVGGGEEGAGEEDEEEASLDEILREQFEGSADDEGGGRDGGEDEPAPPALERADEPARSKGRDEFVCSACFLVRHRRQLADPERMRCRDCAEPGGRGAG